MQFSSPLIKGRLIQRYKRFLADIELESGEIVTAHCANSGSMWGIKDPGITVYLQKSDNPERKLAYSWEMVETGGHYVGCNTGLPNRLIAEALAAKAIPEFAAYETFRREVKYGTNSRIDFLLSGKDLPDCYLEIKNVHMMRQPGLAEFPDSVTSRGAKHLAELSEIVRQGHRAVTLYLVQRVDCQSFTVAQDIDPDYGRNFREARLAGVEILCYYANISLKEITLGQKLKVIEPC